MCPIVLWIGKNRYITSPPKGSVAADSLRVFREAAKGHWSLNFIKMGKSLEWDRARPTVASATNGGERPNWCHWDDREFHNFP